MKSVLVLLSSYCGIEYIEEQLDSIYFQNGVKVGVLIRDDGSKDNTLELLEAYKTKHKEFILEIIQGDNIGSTASFSALIKYAYDKYAYSYDYFSFADQDDYWEINKLYEAIMKMEGLDDNEANTYCSNTKIVDSKLRNIEGIRHKKVEISKARALARNIATGCTMVFNRRALELYATRCPQYIKIHDHALFLICSFLGSVIFDEKSYILYRQHGNNQIGGTDSLSNRNKDRLKHKGNLSQHYLERTAQSFLNAFEEFLSKEDIALIKIMADYRKSFINRLKLLFDRRIAKEEFEDNLFFKLKILLGGV